MTGRPRGGVETGGAPVADVNAPLAAAGAALLLLSAGFVPRRPVRAGTAVPMMGKRPLSKAASGLPWSPFWTLRVAPHDHGCASARVIERILRN